ncbi:unnamed protein product [Brachionus calyciflorus]|uniref:RINT1 n=1 Tax=Brachionus calyciflorus TaxID=104777 RepID=A0A813MBI2_9BILA|nr:unnamed protein product [Brachionus calyciflorus]
MNLVKNIEITKDLADKINDLIGLDRSLLSNNEKSSEIALKLKNKINTLKDKIVVNLPYKFNTNDHDEFLEYCNKIENLKVQFDKVKRDEIQNKKSIEIYKSNDLLNENRIYEQDLKPLVLKSISLHRQLAFFKTLIHLEKYKSTIEDLIIQFENSKANQLKLINSKKTSSTNIDLDLRACLSDQSNILKALITNYLNLLEYSKILIKTKGNNFKKYLNDFVSYLREKLREILRVEFENSLSNLGYPQSTSFVSPTEGSENKERFEISLKESIKYLLIIDESIDEDNEALTDKINTVIDLLVQPLSKRFKFHFFTSRRTNDLSKPEWYLSQILQWIKEQHDFLTRVIQPGFNQNNQWKNYSVVIFFANKLVDLIREKIEFDLQNLMQNSKLFLHTIDELLVFNSQLNSYLETTESFYILSNNQKIKTVLDLICENHVFFSHWLNLEKQVWQKYLDLMFSNLPSGKSVNQILDHDIPKSLFNIPLLNDDNNLNDLWSCTLSDVDSMRTPKCAELFILMIKSITDRFSNLPSVSKRLRFICLQLDLLNDFHLRLCQIIRDEAKTLFSKPYLGVLNTINYVIYVLDEWKNSTFFIEMQFYKQKYQQFCKKYQFSSEQINKETMLNIESSNSSNLEFNEDICNLFDKNFSSIKSLLEIEGSLFDDILPSYEKVKDDMIDRITQNCIWELTSRASAYKREKWNSMPLPSEYYKLTLTQSASDMLISLRNILHLLKDSIAQSLFDSIVKKLTNELDKFYYENLILANQFNEGGSFQLDYDINKYLLPILNEFVTGVKIENYFRATKESITLLKLKQGSTILLKDTLDKALEIEFTVSMQQPNDDSRKLKLYSAKNALKEFGIVQLTCEQVRTILCSRCDLMEIK